jgi:hypothetical protein
LTGKWVTDELKKALEKGYVVQHIYKVWHFDETEQYDPKAKPGGLFTDYAKAFLKMKQEDSAWPEWSQNENDRWRYIRDYHEEEGILLAYNEIKKNAGLRALDKLMLNSFLGIPYITISRHVDQRPAYCDGYEFCQRRDGGNEISIQRRVRRRIRENQRSHSSLFHSTSPFEVVQLFGTISTRALYTDTDSVGYTSRPGEWKPELGDYLGYLTDEVPNNSIIEFFTGGPKNYAYKIAKPDKDGNTTICKVRGITLNYKNYLTINFDAIKDMVINNSDDVKNVMDDFKITRDHKRLLTVHQDKDYKIVFDKRVITQDHST